MTTAAAKAAALEGLDFIETEEDVKAVEAATLKIQSTFRGKKIRSKFGAKTDEPTAGKRPTEAGGASQTTTTTTTSTSASTGASTGKQVNKSAGQQAQQQQQQQQKGAASGRHKQQAEELSKRVGAMQVQDGDAAPQPQAGAGEATEAERAATKIQAGFKGYKTRKELEVGGKLAGGGAAGAGGPGGQQAAPGAK